jgi:hypothetical protein
MKDPDSRADLYIALFVMIAPVVILQILLLLIHKK